MKYEISNTGEAAGVTRQTADLCDHRILSQAENDNAAQDALSCHSRLANLVTKRKVKLYDERNEAISGI